MATGQESFWSIGSSRLCLQHLQSSLSYAALSRLFRIVTHLVFLPLATSVQHNDDHSALRDVFVLAPDLVHIIVRMLDSNKQQVVASQLEPSYCSVSCSKTVCSMLSSDCCCITIMHNSAFGRWSCSMCQPTACTALLFTSFTASDVRWIIP